MWERLRLRVFGRRCPVHDVFYISDFCPQHVRTWVYLQETHELVSREAMLPRRPAVAALTS